LSISENDYPDGNEKYEDRNIWAPHVIYHEGTYYMFYTSVNKQVSQSVSLATSKDLFNWKKHDKNPIVRLEDAEWASWRRDGWADFRDPAILKDGDTFYMYCTVHAKDGRGTVSVCKSRDLFNWTTPTIAAVGKPAMESPFVWKQGGHYYMTTSSTGGGTWKSSYPDKKWVNVGFSRPPLPTMEKYVPTSVSCAEEVVPFGDGNLLMASLTWRYWGNSIYLSKIISDKDGQPTRYESPFVLEMSE
jgi:sucrose-6-phosphate hydrolase SacC (GH32 family)